MNGPLWPPEWNGGFAVHRFSMKRSPENPGEKAWMSYSVGGFSLGVMKWSPATFVEHKEEREPKWLPRCSIPQALIALPYTLPVFNFAILAREYFWRGFISAISTRKYEKRALNFAIYALSTSFNFFLKKSERFQIDVWKLYKLTLFYLLKIQNGAYQYNQLASYIVNTYPVYVAAISS